MADVAIFEITIDASGSSIGAGAFSTAADKISTTATSTAAATDRLSDSLDRTGASAAQVEANYAAMQAKLGNVSQQLQQLQQSQDAASAGLVTYAARGAAFATGVAAMNSALSGIGDLFTATTQALESLGGVVLSVGATFASMTVNVSDWARGMDAATASSAAQLSAMTDLQHATGLTQQALLGIATVQATLGSANGQSVFLRLSSELGQVTGSARQAQEAAAALGVDLTKFSSDQQLEALNELTAAWHKFADGPQKTDLYQQVLGPDAPAFLTKVADATQINTDKINSQNQAIAILNQLQATHLATLQALDVENSKPGLVGRQVAAVQDFLTPSDTYRQNNAISSAMTSNALAELIPRNQGPLGTNYFGVAADLPGVIGGAISRQYANVTGNFQRPEMQGPPLPPAPLTASQLNEGQGFLAQQGVISTGNYNADQTFGDAMTKADDLAKQGKLNNDEYSASIDAIYQKWLSARDPVGTFVENLQKANETAGLQGNALAIAQALQGATQAKVAQSGDKGATLDAADIARVTATRQEGLDKQSATATTVGATNVQYLQQQAAAALYSASAVDKLKAAQTGYNASLQPGAMSQATAAEQALDKAQAARQLTTNTLLRTDAGQASANLAVADAYGVSTAAGLKEEATQKAILDVKNGVIAAGSAQAVSESELYKQATASAAAGAKQVDTLQDQVDASGRLATAAGVSSAALAAMQAHNLAVAATAKQMADAVASGSDTMIQKAQETQGKLEALYNRNDANSQTQAANSQIETNKQNLQLLQLQLDTLNMMPAQREQALAVAKAQLQIDTQLAGASPDQKQTILDQAAAWGQVSGAIQEVQREQQINAQLARNLLQGVQSAFADFFDAILSGGTGTWKKLFTALEQLAFKSLADIASATLLRPLAGAALSALNLGSLGNSVAGGGGGGGLLSLFGGGASNGPSRLVDGNGNVIGTISSGAGNGVGGSSDSSSSGFLSEASSLFGLGRNINSLFGGSGSSLFSGDGAFGGSAINDFFGGQGSSLFSGNGAFSANSINQFGASTGIFSGGLSNGFNPAVDAVVNDATPAFEGLGSGGAEALGDTTSGLVGSTLSEALPYVGVLITLGQAIMSGNVGQIAGTAGGALAGAAVGTFVFPGVGTALGAAIGAVAGDLIGGMFGGKVSAPGSSATMGLDANGQLTTSDLGHFGGPGDPGAGPARAVTDAEASNFSNFNAAYQLQFGSGVGNPKVNYQSGNYTVTLGTGTQSYSSPQQALDALTAGNIQSHSLTSNAPGSQGVAENYVLANTTATTFSDLADALNKAITAAQTYDAEIAATGHTASQTEQSIAQLNQSFQDEITAAQQYGLDTAPLVASFGKQYNTMISDQIEQITNSGQAALDAEQRDADARIAEATQLGADLTQVEQLNGLERTQVVEQANQAILASYQQTAASMIQLIAGLTIGSASPLSPADQLAASAAIYDQTKTAALAGDPTALSSYSSVAQSYLSLARSAYATSAPYVSIYNDVLGTASQIAAGSANAIAFGQNNLLTTGPGGNLPAFATGGSFTVGGTGGVDSQVVSFRASPWENVTIGNSANGNGGGSDVAAAVMASGAQQWQATVSSTKALLQSNASLAAQVANLADSHADLAGSINAVMRYLKAA